MSVEREFYTIFLLAQSHVCRPTGQACTKEAKTRHEIPEISMQALK